MVCNTLLVRFVLLSAAAALARFHLPDCVGMLELVWMYRHERWYGCIGVNSVGVVVLV